MLNGVPVYVLWQFGFRDCGCVPCLWPQLGQDRGALSPLLVALVMEPLATSIWHCTDIKGIFRANQKHKSHYMYTMSFSMCLIFPCPSHISSTLNLVDFRDINFLIKVSLLIATAASQISFYFLPL